MIFLKDNRGFTLLEIVFAIGIFSVVIFGVFSLFNTSFKADRDIRDSMSVQAEASKVVQTFIDELRAVNYSTVGGYPLGFATSTEILFYSNIDTDILTERVRYFVDGNILKKGVTKPTGELLYEYNTSTEQISELVHNLSTPANTVFSYYDGTYNGADATSTMTYPIILPRVRVIGVKLEVRQSSAPNASIVEIKTKVQLRNLKTN